MGLINFTRISDNIVKVDNCGQIQGYAIGKVNIFPNPNAKESVIITDAASPGAYLNGPANGQEFLVEDVNSPAASDKQDLANLLITTIFN